MRPQVSYRIIMGVIAALAGIVGLFVVAIGATAIWLPGCEGCHSEGAFGAATAQGAHAEVACTSCHGAGSVGSRLSLATAQVTGMYLPLRKVDPSVAAVPDTRCKVCHAPQLDAVVENAGLRIVHSSCAPGRQCTECHSPTAHGAEVSWPRSATMQMCFDCHGGAAAPADCDLCHAAKLPDDRVRTDVFAITHGPNYERTHGMGRMTSCSACHEDTKCAKCHGAGLPHGNNFVSEHGPSATSAAAKCTSCHQERFCSDCHGYEMPHPRTFTKGHGRLVDDQGDSSCTKCHDASDCTRCHESHVHPTTIEQLEGLGIDVDKGEAR